MICELGLLASQRGWQTCGGPLHKHHIINKSKYRGNAKVKKYINKHPHIFYADVCAIHNVGRFADTKEAQRFLLMRRCDEWGLHNVMNAVDRIPWKVKPPELSFKGLTTRSDIQY